MGSVLNVQPNAAWILKQIFAGSGDAIVFADRDGKIRLWNGGAERIFGYGESEALGSTLDLIVPERFRDRHWEGYHRVVETGETQYGDRLLSVPGIRRDGGRISLEFTVVLIKGDEGQVEGCGGDNERRNRGLAEGAGVEATGRGVGA